MHGNNVTQIFLLGFPNLHSFMIPLFLVFLTIYILMFAGNIIIIMLVIISKALHSPMYFFISLVSICDILLSTVISPNVLHILIHEGYYIAFKSCLAQFFFFAFSEAFECLLLTVMSYDRYLAICRPLHYTSIINERFCITSALLTWLLSFVMTLLDVIAINKLVFCGPDIMDHFFCDFQPLLELSCSDTFIATLQAMLFSTVVLFCPIIVIITSYVYIILAIWAIPTTTGRHKAFSTCSSHLTVVSIFYGTLTLVYSVPSYKNVLFVKKILSLLYTMVIPLLNPVICSLRNRDIKEILGKIKLHVIRTLYGHF